MREDLKHLTKRVTLNQEEQKRYRELEKRIYLRFEETKNAPTFARMGFWCGECQKDCDALGHKETRLVKPEGWIAFYRALCPQQHVVIRRITDKLSDPYFFQSAFVRKQQLLHAEDFLTPDHPDFKRIYPIQHKRLLEDNEERLKDKNKLNT